jgi:hypothetical protein
MPALWELQASCRTSPMGKNAQLRSHPDHLWQPNEIALSSIVRSLPLCSQWIILFSYLFERHFKLVTDNRSLTRIFYQNAKLPPMTSVGLLRYATFLSAFDYEVVVKKRHE